MPEQNLSKSDQSKEQIMSVALDLFSKTGYHKTSTKNICDAAGISTGLLFYHFGSKEKLLKAIITMLLSRIEETLETDTGQLPEMALEHIIDAFFASLKENSRYWDLYMSLLFQPDTKALILEEVSTHTTRFRRTIYDLMQRMGSKDPGGDSFEFEVFRVGTFASYLAGHNEKVWLQSKEKMKQKYLPGYPSRSTGN